MSKDKKGTEKNNAMNVKEALGLLDQDQIAEFRRCFGRYDPQNLGHVPTRSISAILASVRQKCDKQEVQQFCKDFGNAGKITFENFMAFVAKLALKELDEEDAFHEELRGVFRMYDKEGSGYINSTDLNYILQSLDVQLSEDELQEMISEIDTDNSGTIDFDEFMAAMTKD